MIQISKLPSNSDHLSSHIESFYNQTRPYRQDIEEQEKLFNYITSCTNYLQNRFWTTIESMKEETNNKSKKMRMTKQKFLENMQNANDLKQPWNLIKFGSAAWGTSCRESDVDVAIQLNFKNKISDKKFLLSQLSQVISENDQNGVLMVHSLLHAKYPIIRVNHIRLQHIKFDISIADRFCMKRNSLISEYIDYFEYEYNIPMKKLIVFIKHWTKQRGINNAYRCYLNSFGFTLLIIQFIQCLIANKDKNICNKRISYFVYEFFAFYSFHFDPSKHCVSLKMNNQKLSKKQNAHCFLEVIDPVNYGNNVAQNVGPYQYHRIKAECMRCVDIYKCFNSEEWKMSMFDALTHSDDDIEKVSVDSGYSSNDSVKTVAN